MNFKAFACAALLLVQPLAAIIVEHDSIDALVHYLRLHHPKHILIICDIDNTLAQNPTDFGSDQWFYGLFMHRMKTLNLSAQEAIEGILPHYVAIQHETDLILIEDHAADLLQTLQQTVPVIALTARSSAILDRTIYQLEQLDIDFTRSSLFCTHSFDGQLDHPYHYHNGIIFCGSNSKGKVLYEVLHQFNYNPEVIIMIDDKEKNLLAVQQEVAKHEGVEFIGIRYSRLDHKIESFDPLEGERLLAEFITLNAMQ